MTSFQIFMDVLGLLCANALVLWTALGWLVLSNDEDIFPRIIGMFWLALLVYFDVMVLASR